MLFDCLDAGIENDPRNSGNILRNTMKRSGTADLPLHGGRVPPWLAERMTKLGTAITENIVHDYGVSAFLWYHYISDGSAETWTRAAG